MSPRAWLLLAWVLVGAAVLFVHAVVLWQARRAASWGWRLGAIVVPPIAPVLAWREGRRVAPVAWVILVVAYVVLRLLE